MSVSSDALYLYLLDDLAPHLSPLNKEGGWAPDATPRQVAAIQLRASFYKKFVDKVSPEADDRAFEKFLAVNESCGKWQYLGESWDDELIGELKRSIYDFWNPNGYPLVGSLGDIFRMSRPGPGSSVGSRGNDLYTKLFASPLTSGSNALTYWWEDYVRRFPVWADAETIRQAHYGKPYVVEGSRFHFVPKNVDISRLICVEPVLNTFFQLGFGACLEKRLNQAFGLDFAVQQDRSRVLARLGSVRNLPAPLTERDRPVTIDLSSASDSMSIRMLKEILPVDFFNWLISMRCATGFRGDERVALNMVSTMGNGFTFPLQTMLFACVVFASARVNGWHLEKSRGASLGTFSVFGDDIVCPSAIARDVLRLLTLLGFEVNTQKTFVDGPFRESCGGDYFRSYDVRGVYVKTLRSPQSRYALINALNLWTAKTGISLSKTVQHLLSTVRYQPVPPSENDDAGIKVPYSLVKGLRRSKHLQSILYRRSVARPKALTFGTGEVFTPRGERRRVYNPHGLLLAFVRGSIVSGKIGIRHDPVFYQTRWGVAPYWDHLPSDCNVALHSDWLRWNSAVHCNFML